MNKLLITICSCIAILMGSSNNISYCMEDNNKSIINAQTKFERIMKNSMSSIMENIMTLKSLQSSNIVIRSEKNLSEYIDSVTYILMRHYNEIFKNGKLDTTLGYYGDIVYKAQVRCCNSFCQNSIKKLFELHKTNDNITNEQYTQQLKRILSCIFNIQGAFISLL